MAKIKFRRDTAAAWTDANPILAQGEPGFEHDTGLLKIGDGETEWVDLDYASGSGGDSLTDDTAVTVTVGNTDYFAIVNRANNDDDGVEASAVAYDSEGNLITLHISEVRDGSTLDRLIISKFDSSAALVWQKQIQEDMDFSPSHDVVIDADDNIIVLYSIDGSNNENGDDTVGAIKYTSSGTELWKKDYYPSVIVPITEGFDLNSATITSGTFEGNTVDVVTLVGDQSYLSANTGWNLQESSNSGTTWTTIEPVLGIGVYDGNVDTTPLYLADNSGVTLTLGGTYQYRVTRQGVNSFLELAGSATDGTHTFVAAHYDNNTGDNADDIGYLMKIANSNGSLVWAKSFYIEEPDFGLTPYGMEIDSNGDLVVTGVWYTPGPTLAFVSKFDGTTGAEVWTRVLSGIEFVAAGGDITADSQGNVFVSINAQTSIVQENGNASNKTAVYLAKLNTSGIIQWSRRVGPGPCASVGTGIDCDSLGNVYLSAITTSQKNPNRDNSNFNSDDFNETRDVLAIAKYSTAGAVLWQRYIETDGYQFYQNRSVANNNEYSPGDFDYTYNSGRNLSVSTAGKIAVQATVRQIDADNSWDNTRYIESITFQIDQDGREMTVGSGIEKFAVKASRIPGKFVTLVDVETVDGLGPVAVTVTDLTSDIEVTTPAINYADPEMAQQVMKSAPYEYVFGNDGTLTIPNDGDVRLTQTQLGWFSVFGPANNNNYDIDVRGSCVDSTNGDVYIGGEDQNSYQGFVARYNSAGELLWSIKLYDDDDEDSSGCSALKIHPTTGNIIALLDYYGGSDYALLLEIDPDTARVINSIGFRDLNTNEGVYSNDFDFLSDGKIAVVGRKYDEYQSYSVTPVSGSGIGVLAFLRSNIPGKTVNTDLYVAGTGITGGRIPINSVNRYPGLTTTVQQGSGTVTFDIDGAGGGAYTLVDFNAAGSTNYLVGHKLKVLGSLLGGVDGVNDAILTVTAINPGGVIDSFSSSVEGVAVIDEFNGFTEVLGTNHNVGSGCTLTLVVATDGSIDGVYAFDTPGTNYVTGDVLTVAGTQFLGGASPANNFTFTVVDASVNGNGGVGSSNNSSGTGPTTHWRVQTTSQTPNYSGLGTWTIQENLSGEAFVYVGSAMGDTFAPVWNKVLSAGGANDNERYTSVAVDASNNIYAAGDMIGRNDAAGAELNSYDCAVVSKFNSAGAHQWTMALNDSLDDCDGKQIAVRGNTVVASHYNTDSSQTIITKLDATGAVKWQRRIVGGSESSVAVDTNGDIYAVVESSVESQYGNCIKVVKFNTYGEIIWRKILATHVGWDGATLSEYLNDGRHITLDATHLYISGTTTAFTNSYDNGFLVKLPKSGDCDGVYGFWTIMTDAYDVDKVNTVRATTFTPNVRTGEFELWTPDYESQWWDPSNGDSDYNTLTEICDRDGGAVEFADGTRQTSSAQQIPQRAIFNGADHRLSLEDMGKHIYVTDSNTRIAVPYHNDIPLPIGFTVVIINNSGGSINIDGDGFGTIYITVPGVDTGTYWNLDNPGMATLIKVERDQWFMTGNVTLND
jgi:hypothetical protein